MNGALMSRVAAPAEGVVVRHRRGCAAGGGEACTCRPGFQAQVWSPRDRRPIRRTFATVGEAKRWRQETQVAVHQQRARAPSQRTLREAADEWLVAARAGIVRTRSGQRYKPSAIRSYQQALGQILPVFGDRRLSAISRNQLQDYADRLVAQGAAPSTVRNTILPLRAIFRRALQREEVAVNPTAKLELPANRRSQDRVARPEEAAALIEALPIGEQPLWATALYGGLRRGELQALQWEDVDFEHGLIRIRRSWDRLEGFIEPKSRAGRRRVPLTNQLRRTLLHHRVRQGHGGHGFVFGASPTTPFHPSKAIWCARQAWKRAGLAPIGFHQCRHTYASFMIAAGVNAKALSSYMGHTSITTTIDRYGHLLPGNETEAAGLLEHWLEANGGSARNG